MIAELLMSLSLAGLVLEAVYRLQNKLTEADYQNHYED